MGERTTRIAFLAMSSLTPASLALIKRAETCLQNIAQRNNTLKTFITLKPADQVRKEVRSLAPLNTNGRGLQGRVVSLKDNFCTTDMPTTCASKVLKNYMSPFESTSGRLLRNAGAVVAGKVNMDEFAMGSNNDHTHFGTALNPLFPDTEASAGGSSGGSAASVAADMCDVSLGTDTGGSVRLPGAYCGVFGFKPSYGMISRHGVIAYAQSLDTVGILAKNVPLIETTFDILNKYDEADPTSISPEIRERIANLKQKDVTKDKLKIGIMKEAIIDLSPEVREAWINSLDYLQSQGHEVSIVSVPSLKHSLPTYFIISPAEASSNLARYDGIRYGFRADVDRDDTGNLYAPTRTSGFGKEVQRRILLGTYNLSAGAYGNHFEKAQKVRKIILDEFNDIFASPNVLYETPGRPSGVDVLIHPTSRTTAPTHEEIKQNTNVTDSYINDVLTVSANLAGLPAISVPWGKGQNTVGIQVYGQFGADKLVLDVASLLDQAPINK